MHDGRERGVRVIGQLGKRMRHRIGAHLGQKQGVAIRLLASNQTSCDRAARSRAVLNHQRLAICESRKAV